MSDLLSPVLIGSVISVVLLAGIVNGIAGFGFALIGTMALATLLEPATAVVFMIAPILAANITLVRELSRRDLHECGRRFAPLILAALVGTIIGMAVLTRIPTAPLRVALGIVSLAFVLTVQPIVPIPGLNRAKAGCFVETPPAMLGVGALSGILFGATNVGVQLIAYLRSCELRHSVFVGVVALVFLGINAVRIGVASVLGLYPSPTIFVASVAAGIPAVAGVLVGKHIRTAVTEHHRRTIVLGLLTFIGIRLVLGGLGIR